MESVTKIMLQGMSTLASHFHLTRKRMMHQARLRWRYHIRRNADIVPVFVIAAARSGSTVLLSYLRSLEGIVAPGEVLNPWLHIGCRRHFIGKRKLLKHLHFSLNIPDMHFAIAKILSDHFAVLPISLSDIHAAFPNARYLILYRRTIGEQFVSWKRAQQTGRWLQHNSAVGHQDIMVRVDTEEFKTYRSFIYDFYHDVLSHKWLCDRGLLIAYEQLASNPSGVFNDSICPFLGIPPTEIKTNLSKQNTRPLEQVVENYPDVAALLSTHLEISWPGRTIVSGPHGMRKPVADSE